MKLLVVRALANLMHSRKLVVMLVAEMEEIESGNKFGVLPNDSESGIITYINGEHTLKQVECFEPRGLSETASSASWRR